MKSQKKASEPEAEGDVLLHACYTFALSLLLLLLLNQGLKLLR